MKNRDSSRRDLSRHSGDRRETSNVVSKEELNRGHYVTAVPCTSRHFSVRSKLPNCVPLYAGSFGLTVDCVAQCENISSVKTIEMDLASGPLGKLDDLTLRDVVKAIGYVIECDCEPV